jgi:general secretion pathway protein D
MVRAPIDTATGRQCGSEVHADRVPGLADIPLLGALFKSDTRSRKKTNLMVFLRPVVVRDGDSASRLSLDRYDQIRAQQQRAQPEPSVVMPINESPVLPPMPRGAPSAAPAASAPATQPRSETAP